MIKRKQTNARPHPPTLAERLDAVECQTVELAEAVERLRGTVEAWRSSIITNTEISRQVANTRRLLVEATGIVAMARRAVGIDFALLPCGHTAPFTWHMHCGRVRITCEGCMGKWYRLGFEEANDDDDTEEQS